MNKQGKQSPQQPGHDAQRPLARRVARELTPAEIAVVAGGGHVHTNYTGARGDAPSDSGGLPG